MSLRLGWHVERAHGQTKLRNNPLPKNQTKNKQTKYPKSHLGCLFLMTVALPVTH